MNNRRRNKIQAALDILEEAKFDEQEAFDNLPESFQYGEKGERMEEAMNYLDDAISSLEEAVLA
tara:strand:- start:1320 stop:1511 length:192 start_codon:yes stop_codon:yes gene_type:complete